MKFGWLTTPKEAAVGEELAALAIAGLALMLVMIVSAIISLSAPPAE